MFCLALGFMVFFLRPRDTAAKLLLLILAYYMEPTWGDSPVMQALYRRSCMVLRSPASGCGR